MKVEFKNINFSYVENEEVLNDVSFVIPSGQMVAIIGHNGSGKSTIAKLMAGLLAPAKGEIILDDIVMTSDNVDDLRPKIGIIFQNPDNQFVGSTVRDDIAFGLENHRVERKEMTRRIEHYAAIVDMSSFLERSPDSLSGGQKQRVAIAGVLAMQTQLVIVDEATSMLDPKGADEIIGIIKQLKKEGQKTIVSITHNLNDALFADRVIALSEGQIVLDGTPMEVFKNVELLKKINLQTLENVSLIESIQLLSIDNKKKEELVEALWALTFQK